MSNIKHILFLIVSALLISVPSINAGGTYNLSIGDNKLLSFTPKTGALFNTMVWRSFDDKSVRVDGPQYSSYTYITVIGPNANSTRGALVQCEYKYEWNGLFFTAQEDFYIKVKDDEEDSGGGNTQPTGIALRSTLELNVGEQYTLSPTIYPSGASTTLFWSSSNSSVASVSSGGRVTANAEGNANIYVETLNGYGASCNVTVTLIEPTSVSLPDTVNVTEGSTKTLKAELTPSNAYTEYAWESDDSSIASIVSSQNKTVTIKGEKHGVTNINVKTLNGLETSCVVKVEKQKLTLSANPKGGTYRPGKKIILTANKQDADIYFTLDGSIPSSSSNLYTEPIIATESIILRAIAIGEAYQDSEILTEEYIIDPNATIVFEEGNGTVSFPYVIIDADHLALISDYLSSYFKLGADIDLTSYNWIPIGDKDHPFKGNLDGKGFTISGLKIHNSESDYIGLFGYTNSATISNITISQIQLEGKDYVGGLSGYSNNSKFKNIKIDGEIIARNNIGGIIGEGYHITELSECSFNGNIIGQDNIGGIIGFYDLAESFSSSSYTVDTQQYRYFCELSKRYNIQKNNSFSKIEGNMFVGGIVGYLKVKNNTGYNNTFPFDESRIRYDLEGKLTINFTQNWAVGAIKSNSHAGGLIGGALIISECYAGGCTRTFFEELSQKYKTTTAKMFCYAYNKLNIDNCFNSTNITCKGKYAGGIIGYIEEDWLQEIVGTDYLSHPHTYTDYQISYCSSNGNIISNNGYVGGILGASNRKKSLKGVIQNCTIYSDIYSERDCSGGIIGNGLQEQIEYSLVVGDIRSTENKVAGITIGDNNSATINNCAVCSSSITGKSEVFKIGSGSLNSNIVSEDTQLIIDGNISENETESIEQVSYIPASDFYKGSTYSSLGWDIKSIWAIDEDMSLPYLKKQTPKINEEIVFGKNIKGFSIRGCADFKGKTFLKYNNEYYCSDINDNGVWEVYLPAEASVGDKIEVFAADDSHTPSPSIFKDVDQIAKIGYVDSISLNYSEINLLIGEQCKLTATIYPEDALEYEQLTWFTDRNDIIEFNDKLEITALAEGVASANVLIDGVSATCTVTVCKHPQTITWTQEFNDIFSIGSELELTAESSSGLPISYHLITGEENAVLEGNNLTIINNNGDIQIGAFQDGDDMYEPAEPVYKTLILDCMGVDDLVVTPHDWIKIYDLSGILVYKGKFSDAKLKRGLYIICSNGVHRKCFIN